MIYCIYDTVTGQIVGHSEGTEAPTMPGGFGAVETFDPFDPSTHFVERGFIRQRTPFAEVGGQNWITVNGGSPLLDCNWVQPTEPGTYNVAYLGRYSGTRQVVVRELDAVKAAKMLEITTKRDALLAAGVDAPPYGHFEADPISRSNLNGNVSMATLALADGGDMSVRWRTADNSYVDLDARALIRVGVVVGTFTGAVYATSFRLKDQTDRATTPEEVDAINVETVSWTNETQG